MWRYKDTFPLGIPRTWLQCEILLDWTTTDSNDATKATTSSSNMTWTTWSPIWYQKQYATFNWTTSTINIWTWTQIDDIFASWWTLSCWVNTNSDWEWDAGRIFDKAQTFFYTSWDSWSAVKLTFEKTFSTTWWKWTTTNTVLNDATWYFVVLTYNAWATTNDPTIYVNWVSQAVTEDTTPVWSASTDASSTAYLWNDSASWKTLDWSLAMVRLYNRVITQREIDILYLEWLRKLWQDRGNYPSLFKWCIAYYDFKWDALDIIWSNNLTLWWWVSLTTDYFWKSNSAYSFTPWQSWYAIFTWPTWTDISASIVCWNFTDNSPQDYHFILADSRIWQSNRWLYIEYRRTTSKFSVSSYNWSAETRFTSSSTYTASWTYFLILTKSWTAFNLYIYTTSWYSETVSWTSNFSWVTSTTWAMWKNYTDASNWDKFLWWVIHKVILWTKVLSASEVKQLYELQAKKYIYPFNKTLPRNLRNWLQLWLTGSNNWTTMYDSSWNWRNWTMANVTMWRRWTYKIWSYNWSNSRINVTMTNNFSAMSYWWWFKNPSTQSWYKRIVATPWWTTFSAFQIFNWGVWEYRNIVSWVSDAAILYPSQYADNKWHFIFWVNDWTTCKAYMDWKLIWTASWANPQKNNIVVWYDWIASPPWQFFNWEIGQIMLWNRALTWTEVQQLYYSQYLS